MDSFVYMKPGIIANDALKVFNELGPGDFCKKFSGELNGQTLFTVPPGEYIFYTKKPKFIELTDAVEENPYHLFFYMIARFYYVDHGTNPIYYYYPNKKNCYISETVLANLPARFHRELEKNRNEYEYTQLPALEWKTYSVDEPWVYSYVRDLFAPLWTSTKQIKGNYIYISRSRGQRGTRIILNESDIKEDMKRLGVSYYYMEDLTFQEQIRLFRSSELIISSHGAGLSFSIFCEPGTQIIEIWKDLSENRHYNDIATKCGLRFNRFTDVEFFEEQKWAMRLNTVHFIETVKYFIKTRTTAA